MKNKQQQYNMQVLTFVLFLLSCVFAVTTATSIPILGLSLNSDIIEIDESNEPVYILNTVENENVTSYSDLQKSNIVTETILREVNATLIRKNLRYLTRNPHMAGTIHDDHLADYIHDQWTAQGLDSVKKISYECLLSYPDVENPNKVHLLDSNDNIIFTSKHKEDVLRPEDQHDDFVHMFNAYAANGTVEGELVYANYARPDDFKTLIDSGINVTGKIVIARYGIIYRGNKVKLAESYGALGIILFSDPFEYAQLGEEAKNVYPNTWWLQSSGAQRGSVKSEKGDPLTPEYPSIDGAYRIPEDDAAIPRIPCQPIGYGDAKELLKLLGGAKSPANWQKSNETHRNLGPGFTPNSTAKKVRLVVNNQLKTVNVTNVIGIIRGSTEPDRYVLAGNHRDSWGFGAVDASSGTSQLLEVTRVLGKLVKQRNWRPKRTLVFCSWGGEEFGLIGSTEWVEDNLVKLSSRAVAYINTDICTSGDVFSASASPLLQHLVVETSKQVPAPNNNSATLFDAWKEIQAETANLDHVFRKNWEKNRLNDSVVLNFLGGGTDHVPFAFTAGVASIDLTFQPNKLHTPRKFGSYPAYHTGFDTFYLVDNFIDPHFNQHKACGHLNGLLLHKLADADILPFNVTHYAKKISEAFQQLKTIGLYEKILNHNINIDLLETKIEDFVETANEFNARLLKTNTKNPNVLRSLNDQMIHLDQTLLLHQGLPLQKQYRHVVFSLSFHNFYGSSAFPGIQDLMFDIDSSSNPEETWTEVKKHVSDVIIAIHQATHFLKPHHLI